MLCITSNSIKHQSFVYWQLNNQKVLFPTILFSISHMFILSLVFNSSIWHIAKSLLDTTTPDQSEPGSDGNKGVLHIPHTLRITGVSPSDCLISYQDTLCGVRSYPFVEVQLVYSTAPAEEAESWCDYLYIYIYIYSVCVCLCVCVKAENLEFIFIDDFYSR